MGDELEMRPIISRIFISLERIRKLAAGVVLRNEPQPKMIPRVDMEDALWLAQGIEETIKDLRPRVEPLRSFGWSGVVSELLYGSALSGAEGIRRTLSNRLERPSMAYIEPIHISVLITFDSRITGSEDLLLVLSGELVWNNSPLSAISKFFNDDINAFTAFTVDIGISLLPVWGQIYDISTGLIGFRLPDAQKLTNTERSLRILGVGVGVLLGLVIKGVRVSSRTLSIISAAKKAQVLRTNVLSKLDSFRALSVAVAKMSRKNAQVIIDILKILKSGDRLTRDQRHIFWAFFHALNQTAAAAHWSVLIRDPANIEKKVGKVIFFKLVKHQQGEKEAIEV